MAPLSYLSVIMVQYPGLPARSQPLWTQYHYLPLVAIAAIVLVFIASCGDDDAPVGPRDGRRSAPYDPWSDDDESIADVETGHDMDVLPQRPIEAAGTDALSPAPSMPPPSPSAPPPYSRRAPFPY
ncbi:hypothetical protein V8D89_008663 [Ganoderma adspersum]